MILLYANQPLEKCGERYFTQNQNFVDFLIQLTQASDEFVLAAPCQECDGDPPENLIEVSVPDRIIEVETYQGHLGAIRASLRNLPRLRGEVQRALARGEPVQVGGPGPNSTLFLLSLVVPRAVRFSFFIRGNTIETVRQIYAGRRMGWIAPWLTARFQRHIQRLLQRGRAQVFTFGPKLAEQYQPWGEAVYPIAPLIGPEVIGPQRQPTFAPHGIWRFLFIGRFSEEKGILSLIQALERLRRHGYSAELTLVGFGPQQATIAAEVQRLGLKDFVHIAGFVPHGSELLEVIDDHDVLCLPSRTEGTPRVLVEAFARTVPVIATPVGSIPNMFPGDVVLTDGLSVRAIAESMAWCLNNPDELGRRAQNGWQKTGNFLISHYVDEVVQRMGVREDTE